MRRHLFWAFISVTPALIAKVAGQHSPCLRYAIMISGFQHLPDPLPALLGNNQVHYQPGAEDLRMMSRRCRRMASRGLKPCVIRPAIVIPVLPHLRMLLFA